MNVNNKLSKPNEWFSCNKLYLNVKTILWYLLKMRINNFNIVKVRETKFLGKHNQNVSNKISK